LTRGHDSVTGDEICAGVRAWGSNGLDACFGQTADNVRYVALRVGAPKEATRGSSPGGGGSRSDLIPLPAAGVMLLPLIRQPTTRILTGHPAPAGKLPPSWRSRKLTALWRATASTPGRGRVVATARVADPTSCELGLV
jgi:hypothetical protein